MGDDRQKIISPFVLTCHTNPYQPLMMLRGSSFGHQGQQNLPEYSLNWGLVGWLLSGLALDSLGFPRIFQADISSHIISAPNRVVFLPALRTSSEVSFLLIAARDRAGCLIWTPRILTFGMCTHIGAVYKIICYATWQIMSLANSGFDCCCLCIWINTMMALVRWLSIATCMQSGIIRVQWGSGNT